MGKLKELFNGPYKRLFRYMAVLTAAFLFTWIVGPGHTFIHWGKAALQVQRQEKVISKYEEENAELDRRINIMKHNRDTLEKFAREQYNFAAPGEDVYLVE